MIEGQTLTRVVYLGPVTLKGNKPGELWATEEAARSAHDAAALYRIASPFGKGRRSSTVGAIYEAKATVEDGKLQSMSRTRTYRAMLTTDAVVAMALRAKGLQAQEKAERAEAKARKAGVADDLLNELARIVAATPLTDQEHVIRGFSTEVRKRALEIWRKQR